MSASSLPNHNPVDRLRKILTDVAKADTTQSIPTVICYAMNLPDNNVNFVTGISHVIQLIENIESQIDKYLPTRKEDYSRALIEIKNAISNLVEIAYRDRHNWENSGNLRKANWLPLTMLNLCSKDFADRKIFLEIDELDTLSNDIEELINYIINSSLDEHLKNTLSY
jgi:hypothetical protein